MPYLARKTYDLGRELNNWRRNFRRKAGIWATDLRLIESRFGSGIVSYFVLLRWTFLLNLFVGTLWIIFVIIFGLIEMFLDGGRGWKVFAFASQSNDSTPASVFFQYYHPSSPLPPSSKLSGGSLVSGIFTGGVCGLRS
jgi:hypothetical protein